MRWPNRRRRSLRLSANVWEELEGQTGEVRKLTERVGFLERLPAGGKGRSLPVLVLVWGGRAGAGAAHAQRAPYEPTILHLPGKTVEVIGLEDWTVPMLQDSLRRYAEGITLDSHACAAVLRQRLGFADAAVVSFATTGDTTVYVAVSVVEPADSARVRRRTVGRDTLGFPPGWEAAGALLRRDSGARWALSNGVRELPTTIPRDSAALVQLWAFVDRVRDSAEYASAARVLESHPNLYARLLAAAVLRNAPADERLLYALVRAMRDDAGIVSVVAASAIARMAPEIHGVDWTPVVEDVHALLDGSNLFVLDALMGALVALGVGRRWAVPFLAGGGHAVLARMAAEDRRMWIPAHALLVALRGADLGRDPAAWVRWAESLE
jgi:hypothetical protein